MDDNILALVPVDRGSDLVFVTKLEGIDHSDYLVKRTAGLGRVRDGETDDLLGVDHEDGPKRSDEIQSKSMIEVLLPDSEGDALRIDVGGINGIQHVIESRDATVWIGNLSNRYK